VSVRLPPLPGEWIERDRPLRFRFEGREYGGFAGDTLSSALWAAGVRVLGRSFKYHRPRGVLSLANHDANALMADGASPNVRADVVPLQDGMRIHAVNTFGGVESDHAGWMDKLSAFLPVGFYYKAFYRPKWAFPHWERAIRRLSGLGAVDAAAPRVRTAKRYDFADVLVVGAGPAGLAAAIAAARGGASVILADENAHPGGSLTYARASACSALRERLLDELQALAKVSVRTGTFAAGYYADHWVPLVDAEKITKVRARALIVACGAFEQPAVFRNNDLPGVMLASAAQRLVYRYAAKPAENAVVLTANQEGYQAALDLLDAGSAVAAVVDLRPEGESSPASHEMTRRGVPVLTGRCILEALRGRRSHGVGAVIVSPWLGEGRADLRSRQSIRCDGVLMSVGFAPAAALLCQAGAKLRYAHVPGQFVPFHLPPGIFAAGKVHGVYDLDRRVADGERAAQAALAHLGLAAAPPAALAPEARAVSHPFPIVAHSRGKNFVDFDEDLQLADFHHAAQEGFDSIELLKRYTTAGMGPSQGKHSNMNAVRVLASILEQPVEAVGTTTARPFFHPVPLAHLAGRGFHPVRRTALHARHEALGALFMEAGVWLRPEHYARAGMPKEDVVREEARAVRTSAGLIDVGTLGKIELSGPDAAELLERVYTGRFANMKPGTTRYGVMLDEPGVVIDDGVVARLGEERFYFTTTTTGSANVYRELQRWIALWGLSAGIANLTGALCAVNLAGPCSRRILSRLADFDVSEAAFPYLSVREGGVAGVPARVLRVGFVGELGFEIHMPSEQAAALWDALMQTGAPFDIRPFGVEAQRLLRLEKGHLIIGQDTDGLTTPFEAGLDWAVKMDKPFFVGQRSLRIVQKRAPRQRLAGFALRHGHRGRVPNECHLVIRNGAIAGRVTSVAYSETLQRHIGLAFVTPELAEQGKRFLVRVGDGSMVEAEVVRTPFYDPDGLRQRQADAVGAGAEALPA
jgi:sarcosine oxidase subunit alpha